MQILLANHTEIDVIFTDLPFTMQFQLLPSVFDMVGVVRMRVGAGKNAFAAVVETVCPYPAAKFSGAQLNTS